MDYTKYRQLKDLEIEHQQVTIRIPTPLVEQIDVVMTAREEEVSRNKFIVQLVDNAVSKLSKKLNLN